MPELVAAMTEAAVGGPLEADAIATLPNQTDPAFDLFAEAVGRRAPDTRVMSAEDVFAGAAPGADGLIVAVTENHPLPGMDFDVRTRDRILEMLASGESPVPAAAHYAGTFGPRPCSAEAAAEVLFGEIEARGASPVSVPGAGVEAR